MRPEDMPDWLGVSRETLTTLKSFRGLVKKWNPVVNLIAKSTEEDIWHRHVLDSAQLFCFAPNGVGHWADLGSGAGFPGIVIAILAKELNPDMVVTLVESDRRKAVFIAEAIRTFSLPARVVCERIESVAKLNANVISARALTSLDGLCGFAFTHLRTGGVAVFPKGSNALLEVEAARKKWKFSLNVTPSRTEPTASILALKDITHG